MQDIKKVEFHISKLEDMKKYPKNLYYIGNTDLLKKKKIAIVGSRHPNQYAQQAIYELSNKLSNNGICIVSGGAIGTDIIAHKAAGTSNTIMVAGTGLDKRYPRINANIIQQIEQYGLVLSQFETNTPSNRWNFPLRNELIVALCDILIVAYADIKSGTMRSVEYALKMGKEIYVLPHRITESKGTNLLLKENKAKAIYDIDDFVAQFCDVKKQDETIDEFLEYCKFNPTYDEAISKYGEKVFEYELLDKIFIENGKIFNKTYM